MMKPNITEEIKRAVKYAVDSTLDEYDIRSCCINCEHFNEMSEFCKLTVPASRPPARVIAFGCPAFKDNDK